MLLLLLVWSTTTTGNGVCSFYQSCCFGELLYRRALSGKPALWSESALATIEKKCPGSDDFRNLRCSAVDNGASTSSGRRGGSN